jgi:hypothetical protein
MKSALRVAVKKKFYPGIIFTTLVATSGCGKSSGGSKEQPIDLPVRVFEAPAAYSVSDINCQKETDKIDLTSGTIPAWQGDQVGMVTVNLANTFTALSLRNSVVKDTVFGVEYERRCDYSKEAGKKCLDRFDRDLDYATVEGKGWYLRLCDSVPQYPRKSVETIALTSAHYLDLAHKTYLELKEKSAAVPPQLLLNVLPLFTDIYDNYYENGERKIRKEYVVNNLAYYGGKNMIIVFPASKKSDEVLPGYFWESQFVLGHEYGHHVEKQRTGFLKQDLGINWNPINHSWEDQELLKFTETGSSEFTQVLGAVSEGFADLLAFYAEGGTSYSLTGIPTLGQNRDIRVSTFRSKNSKILTPERLSLLTHRTSVASNDSEEEFENIHTGGAVLAHAADQIFKATSLARLGIVEGSKEDIEFRYKLLLNWIDKTGQGLSLVKADPAETHLEKISNAFATVVNDSVDTFTLRPDTTEKKLQSEVCSILSEVLPVLAKPAFSLSGGGC